ncbi:MAG: ribonuclease P protein component [Candidatus Aminicenantia bacterium]
MHEKFTARERIKRKKDFNNLYKKGKRINSRYFTLIFIPNKLDYSRVAIGVSKSIGKSVKRNKIKRWFRELFRRNKDLFTVPLDVLFLAKKEILEIDWKELLGEYKKAITTACQKTKIE